MGRLPWKKIKSALLRELLVAFVTATICLTCVSFYIFDKSLPVVIAASPAEMALQHREDFIAEFSKDEQGEYVVWSIEGSKRNLSIGDFVTLKVIQTRHEKNGLGLIKPSYQMIKSCEVPIEEITYAKYNDSNGNPITEYTFTAYVEDVIAEDAIFFINVPYEGQEQSFVLPADCVKGDLSGSGNTVTICEIKERLMPWGYTSYVKEVLVEVIERNQEYIAVRFFPGEIFLRNASSYELNDGDWVKVQQ